MSEAAAVVASPLGTAAAPESICAGLQLCAPQQPRCAEGFYCYKGQLCLPIKAETVAFDEGAEFHRKSWARSVPRNGM